MFIAFKLIVPCSLEFTRTMLVLYSNKHTFPLLLTPHLKYWASKCHLLWLKGDDVFITHSTYSNLIYTPLDMCNTEHIYTIFTTHKYKHTTTISPPDTCTQGRGGGRVWETLNHHYDKHTFLLVAHFKSWNKILPFD